MDEMNNLPENQNNEEIKEQGVPTPETAKVSEPIANIPTPKLPIPKLPLIIGSAVAGVAAIAITVGVVLGGGGHQHSYGEWKTVDAPTCLAAGIEERICECNERETRPIAALGHVYDDKYDENCNVCGYERDAECAHTETEAIEGKEATCTATGLTDGSKCKKCSETIIEQETIPMSAHTYDDKYDEDCNICGHKRDAECAHAETLVVLGKAATCTATGLTDGSKCKKCGETLVSQTVIPAKPHNEVVDPAVAATCTSTGLTEGKHCSVCSTVIIMQNTIPAAHKYSNDYEYNDDYHWCNCNVCDEENKSTHITDDEGFCSICNHIVCLTPGVIYDVSADGTYAEVVDYTGTATKVRIGTEYNGLPVSAIAYGAFAQKTITDIIIPSSITQIGERAFEGCESLINIKLSDGLQSIGYAAFNECRSIKKIIIPDTVTRIGAFAFLYCSKLQILEIGKGIKYIGSSAFNCCGLGDVYIYDLAAWCSVEFDVTRGLMGSEYTNPLSLSKNLYINGVNTTDLIIPEGVTTINSYAFYKCKFLTSISFPESLTAIGGNAFEGCGNNLFNIVDGVSYLNNWAIKFDGSTAIVNIQEGTIGIGASCFYNSSKLRKVNIPSTVKYVGNGAFNKCTGLTSVEIPDSVTSIDDYAFYGCSNLVSFAVGNGVTSIGLGVFWYCDSIKDIYITDIASWCNIRIDDSEYSRFSNNAVNLYLNGELVTNLVIPDGVTTIERYAFIGCSSLTSVVIPDSVNTIGYGAFDGCESLTSVVIGDNITSIGDEAFDGCSKLKNVYYTGSEQEWKTISIGSYNSYLKNATIHYNYVPEN